MGRGDAQPFLQELREGRHLDLVLDRSSVYRLENADPGLIRGAKVGRVSPDLARQRLTQRLDDRRSMGRRIGLGEEEQEAGSPLVVGRTNGVETEHIRTRPDAGRGVDEPGKLAGEDRGDRLTVERLAQLKPGNEVSHGRDGETVRRRDGKEELKLTAPLLTAPVPVDVHVESAMMPASRSLRNLRNLRNLRRWKGSPPPLLASGSDSWDNRRPIVDRRSPTRVIPSARGISSSSRVRPRTTRSSRLRLKMTEGGGPWVITASLVVQDGGVSFPHPHPHPSP